MPETVPYSIDSSSLMDWQARYYPTDVFAGIVTRIDGMVAENRFLAPALVREEIGVVGTPDLKEWARSRSGLFVPTAELLAAARGIQGRFPGLIDPKAEFEEADAYVIALAQMRGGIVVTQETSAAEKNKPKRSAYIPDVCREMGIFCISFLGFIRREGWRFD